MSKEYLISRETLFRLVRAELELTALEAGGVCNWEWCSDSLNEYLKMRRAEDHDVYEDYDELAESVIEKEYELFEYDDILIRMYDEIYKEEENESSEI